MRMAVRGSRLVVCVGISVCFVVGLWAGRQEVNAQQRVRLNPVIDRLERGEMALSDVDWISIDMEHSPYLLDRLETILRNMADKKKPSGQFSLAPIVRIPMEGDEDFRYAVKQVLDLGALGVIFPHIETKEEATKAIRAMRYPPQRGAKYPEPTGARGFNPANALKIWGISRLEYLQRADVWPLNPEGELFAMLTIESPAAVRNINEILDVPGIGAVYLGPNDLGISLGVGPSTPTYAPETEAAMQTVLNACIAKKKICATSAVGGESDARKRIEQGYKMVLVAR